MASKKKLGKKAAANVEKCNLRTNPEASPHSVLRGSSGTPPRKELRSFAQVNVLPRGEPRKKKSELRAHYCTERKINNSGGGGSEKKSKSENGQSRTHGGQKGGGKKKTPWKTTKKTNLELKNKGLYWVPDNQKTSEVNRFEGALCLNKERNLKNEKLTGRGGTLTGGVGIKT